MWVTVGIDEGKKIVLYHYHSSRRGEIAVRALDGYRGYLQTDGYSGYNEVASVDGIEHVSDFVHIRRQFERADQASKGNGEAKQALEYIGELYRTEKELRAEDLSNEQFVQQRKRMTEKPLESMYQWIVDTAPEIPPKTLLGKAFTYAMGQWDEVIRYLEPPLMTPATNLVENAIRPNVVGRKNWLFAATPRGAHASAALYSLVESAKAQGLEPYRYFCYIFRKLPAAETDDDYQALLPHRLTPEDLIDPG